MIRVSIWRDDKQFVAIPGNSSKRISTAVAVGNPIQIVYRGLFIPGYKRLQDDEPITDQLAKQYPLWATCSETDLRSQNLYHMNTMVLIRDKAILLTDRADIAVAGLLNIEQLPN